MKGSIWPTGRVFLLAIKIIIFIIETGRVILVIEKVVLVIEAFIHGQGLKKYFIVCNYKIYTMIAYEYLLS